MRKQHTHPRAAALLLAAALLGSIGIAAEDKKAAPPKSPPPTGVEVATVTTGNVTATITAVGTLQADESVVIRPEIAGRVAEIHFAEGQPVAAGTLLLRLDDSVARAEYEQAEADLALAKSNYDRAIDLFKKGSGSARTRDETLAALQAANARVALARATLDKTRIVAPFSGLLGLRQVSIGDYLTPGQAIVNLEDVDPVKVDFRVPETFLARVHQGQSVQVQVDAFPDRNFSGEVYALDPRIDATGRSVALRARIANSEGLLRPGLFARVSLVTEQRDDALLIPEQAIFARGAESFVYVVHDGKAKLTRIALGLRQGAQVEVVEGLSAGDQVVSAGHLKLRDGAPVRPVGSS